MARVPVAADAARFLERYAATSPLRRSRAFVRHHVRNRRAHQRLARRRSP